MASVSSPSHIFQIHKGPRAVQATSDVQAELWPATVDSSDANVPCQVCQERKARYKCPRCSMQYCSSDCYKKHDGNVKHCTESFYQDRVSRVTRLENSAKQDDFHRLLNRSHRQRSTESDIIGDETIYEQSELLDLLSLIDKGNWNEVSTLLERKPEWRTAIDSAVRRGELSEWLLEPWVPWWRMQLSGSLSSEQEESTLSDHEGVRELLDERLLDVPSFHTIQPKHAQAPPQLAFNVLEIILATVATLRLFHGCSNAKQTSVDASQFLIQTSQVLSKDLRLQSIHEALMVFSETLANNCISFGNSMSHLAFEDLTMLLKSRRFTAKALLEATDILSAALIEPIDKANKKSIYRCRRKIEFYLSWVLDLEVSRFDGFADKIDEWIADWQLTSSTAASTSSLLDLCCPHEMKKY